ncbi:MAG: hypothetical protein NVS9B13_18130 [Candidatus Acidiferrum sp.]
MKNTRIAMKILPVLLAGAGIACSPVAAQNPVIPIVLDTAVPIIIKAVKPAPLPEGQQKFEGFVMNANTAQITLRAKGNDMAIRTFSLSEQAAAKMQQIVDKGGYQYGDKVTVYYDTASMKALKFKGKASKAL